MHTTSGYTQYGFKVIAGTKSAIGYSRIVVEGTNLNSGTLALQYASSAGAAPSGTNAVSSQSSSGTNAIAYLTTAAINAGNVYWYIYLNKVNSNATITRIYWA